MDYIRNYVLYIILLIKVFFIWFDYIYDIINFIFLIDLMCLVINRNLNCFVVEKDCIEGYFEF